MKKFLLILAASTLVAVLLASCLKSEAKAGQAVPQPQAEKQAVIAKDAKIIKVSNGSGPSFPPVIASQEKFKKIVEEKTNGKYKVEVYHSGQLGDDVKATEALKSGTLETCITSTAPLVGIVKELAIFDIPFLFTSEKTADAVLDGPIGQDLAELLPAKGLVNLAWCENGFRHLTNSVRPVKAPADLKGLKIRTMENPFHLASWKALGANPTPMSWSEVFTALQQKSIDGQENPIPNFFANKIHEVNKYISLTGHVYSPMLFLFSKQIFDTYPKEDQEIIKAAAREMALYERQINREAAVKNLEQIKAAGGVVTELSAEQKKAFQDLTASVWGLVEAKVGPDLIKRLKTEIAKAPK